MTDALYLIELLQHYHDITGIYLSLVTVESATGGRIADAITNIPGSSNFFSGSIISYSNDLKERIAGVKEETLITHGAVSYEAAKEMAEGGKKLLEADICLSDTGIAGPGGGTPDKPVGLFYFGLSTYEYTKTFKRLFTDNRESNKQQAAETAVLLLEDYVTTRIAELNSKQLKENHVVTSIIQCNETILIVKRSQKVGSYRGHWSAVSGYLQNDDYDQALIEITEETGLKAADINLIKRGSIKTVIDETINSKWIVHPFLFKLDKPEKITLDWENTEFKWIRPEDISHYRIVPGLKDTVESLFDR
jgi:nicotinamide-nucleotide amidase